jgi:hypothetical protein
MLGDYLGEFTNEIDSKDGHHISEFISTGPKSYGYKLDTGKSECTIKGYTFNKFVTSVLNFESLKEILLENRDAQLIVPQLKFIRDKKNWQVSTSIIEKKFRLVYTKRVIQQDFTTRPFGYVNN